jgi:MFS family permease
MTICAVQAVLGLDLTIVNAALPDIHRALFTSGDGLVWVADGYSLGYGGLLLAGGRIADLAGPKAVLAAGLALFAGASGCAGLAGDAQLLVAARIAQGAGAALAAPAALALLITITPAALVHRALAGYAAAAGAGAAIGQLVGGIVIHYLDWRWVLLVNVPAGVLLALGILALAPTVRGTGGRRPLDLPGTLTGTAALLCLIWGVLRAGDVGWSNHLALGALACAGAFTVAFTVAELKARNPLVPGRLLRSRERLAGYLTGAAAYAWMYPVLYLLTLVMQDVHGWTALRAGVYWLPVGLGTIVGGLAAGRLALRRLPVPVLLAACTLVLAGSSLWLAQLTPASGYLAGILPAFGAMGVAFGAILALNVRRAAAGAGENAGVAAGILGTCQQVGAAVSLAVTVAIATASTQRAVSAWETINHALAPPAVTAAATVHGFDAALIVTTGIAVVASAAQALPYRSRRRRPQ